MLHQIYSPSSPSTSIRPLHQHGYSVGHVHLATNSHFDGPVYHEFLLLYLRLKPKSYFISTIK